MSVLTAPLVGCQTPRIQSVPPYSSSAGDDAIELAASAGLFLDEWQQLVLRNSLGERSDGKWVTPDVGLVVSRQNGKNAVLEARELAGLFLFGEQLLIHTAHEMKAAAVTFNRLEQMIRRTPHLLKRVKNFARSKGDEGIELHDGARLRFMARTGGSGRSFSCDFLALDEAFNIPQHVVNAATPTMAARPNPQKWFTSSAVNQLEQPHGLTLARIRRRALAGVDPSLSYHEWSGDEDGYAADPKGYASDPRSWAVANPGLGIRIPAEFLAGQLRIMGAQGFAAEHLSIGDWPAEPTDELPRLVDQATWDELIDRFSAPLDPVAFAVHASEKGASAAVCVAGRRADGLFHGEVLANQRGVSWVVDFVAEKVRRNHPCAVVVDPHGPAGPLITPLQNAGVEVTTVTAGDYKQACEAWYTAVTERDGQSGRPLGGFRHMDDPRLNAAVEHAATRDLMQGWVFDQRKSSADLSPLVAVVLAMHGLVRREHASAGGWMVGL